MAPSKSTESGGIPTYPVFYSTPPTTRSTGNQKNRQKRRQNVQNLYWRSNEIRATALYYPGEAAFRW